MQFYATRGELFTPLKIVNSVIEPKNILPILTNVLIQVTDESITLTGTNTELEMVCSFASNDTANIAGEITLPAKKLLDICKSLSDETVLQVTIEKYLAIIKAGKSKFKLQTLPAEEFPTNPKIVNPATFEFSQKKLRHLIKKTSFCVANNDVRYYLNGLLLDCTKDELHMIGTDGHRMALAKDESFETTGQQLSAIIPRQTVLELLKVLKNDEIQSVEVAMDTQHIQFKLSENQTVTSKLIDGQFPSWDSIIPPYPNIKLLINNKEIKQALKRVLILANTNYNTVKLTLSKDLLVINASNSLKEEAKEILEIEFDFKAKKSLEIGFNGNYLLEIFEAIYTDMVQLEITYSPDDPKQQNSLLITNNNSGAEKDKDAEQYIVMPVRL